MSEREREGLGCLRRLGVRARARRRDGKSGASEVNPPPNRWLLARASPQTPRTDEPERERGYRACYLRRVWGQRGARGARPRAESIPLLPPFVAPNRLRLRARGRAGSPLSSNCQVKGSEEIVLEAPGAPWTPRGGSAVFAADAAAFGEERSFAWGRSRSRRRARGQLYRRVC